MTWLSLLKSFFLFLLFTHSGLSIARNLRSADSTDTEAPGLPQSLVPVRRRVLRWTVSRPPARFMTGLHPPSRFTAARRPPARFVDAPNPLSGLTKKRAVAGSRPKSLWTGRLPRERGAHEGLCATAWKHFIDLGALWNYGLESPVILGQFLLVAFAEELIWRVCAQPVLIEFLSRGMAALWGTSGEHIGIGAGILVVAVLFAASHKHFFQNTALVSLEFMGFAILLGVLYYLTSSFVLLIVIHAIRDIEITYLEYTIKVEELGDKELAAKEVERTVVKMGGLRRPNPKELLVQLPVFYTACVIGYWEYGAFTRELVSPVSIALGLVAGHLVFGVSLLVTLQSSEYS